MNAFMTLSWVGTRSAKYLARKPLLRGMMRGMKIPIKCHLMPDRPYAQFPRYQTEGSSGADLVAAIPQTFTIPPMGRASIPTGIQLEIPEGYEGQVRPRSGISIRDGAIVILGTIDCDFRGECGIIIINLSGDDFDVFPGMRLAQLVISPVVQGEFIPTQEENLSPTMRGINGYGSTGT